MPAIHEKGFISEKRDFFYYCADLEQWFRLLVRGGIEQGYLKEVAIAITPPGGFAAPRDILELSKEFIFIYDPFKPNHGDIHTHVLPRDVYNDVVNNLGEEMANKIIDHNYIAIIDLKKLIDIEEGEYLSEILDANPKYDRVKARVVEVPGYYKRPTGFSEYD